MIKIQLYKILFFEDYTPYYTSAKSYADAVDIIINWWNNEPCVFSRSEHNIQSITKINHCDIRERIEFVTREKIRKKDDTK